MKEQEASGLFLRENFFFQGISIVGIIRSRYKMVSMFFCKKIWCGVIKSEIMPNQQ